MDLATLLGLLQANLVGQTLTIRAQNDLQSPPIDALIGNAAYYPSKTLVLALDQGTTLKIVGDAIPATGTFQQAFLGQSTPRSTLRFTVVSGIAQLVQSIALPASWTFPASFPALAGGVLDGAAFASPAFVLASAASPPYAAGLNFDGVADLTSAGFAPLGWIWPSGARQRLIGTVVLPADVAKGVPAIALAAAQAPTTIALVGVTYMAALTLGADPAATPAATIGIASTLDVGGGLAPFALSGAYDAVNGLLTAAMEGDARRLTTLDQLVALAGGSSLSNVIPSQFSLGDLLLLSQLNLQLLASPQFGTLAAIGMTVALDVQWVLVPDLVSLDQIRLAFIVGQPTSRSLSLTASINGRFTLTNPNDPNDKAQIDLGVLLPSLVFTGSLVSGQIDLVGAVAHFFGGAPALEGKLPIVALGFSIDVANRTYVLDPATVKPSDSLALTMGSDLPEAVSILKLEEISLALRRTPTLFAASIAAIVELLGATWNIVATYTGSGGWVFSATLAKTWPLLELIEGPNAIVPASWNLRVPSMVKKADVTALAFSYDFGAKTFSFTGAAELELLLTDTLRFDIEAGMHVESKRPGGTTSPAQYSGSVRGKISLNDISLTVVYAFQPKNSQISFIFQEITGTYDTNDDNPFVRVSFGNTTVGGILEFLIGLGGLGPAKLPAPWNVLDSISLNGLQITVYLNTKAIQIVYPISLDLGFIKIDKITFDYKKVYGQSQIEFSLDASFLGQKYPALAWNPVTQAPPALPGAGAALFDLQYLGIGQHVALRNTDPSKPLDTVSKVITALRNALNPVPNPNGNPLAQLPGLAFDSGSNWLIGAQFTIAGTFSMSLVFNDPNVYGLLISVAGAKAGVFAGLQFEILYRKVTDSIGVYHIELKLPDVMRRLQLGQVTITLPVVALDIYTNGDFRIDMGFPASMTDFSRSFAIEFFPFTGAGGFYFAKLSGDTSLKVPKIDNGRFSPVIEFGIALAVGLGKSIELGILSGGISITVQGMVQGVYASFEPNDANVPSATFFSLNGTFAIVGKVYATVDFGIIQANVSLTVYASVSVAFQTYEPIFIEVSAGVTVRVSIKIVFFRINFSFSATVRESFTIGSRSTPPWHVITGGGGGGGGANALLSANGVRRLRAQRAAVRPRTLLARHGHAHPRVRSLRPPRAMPVRFSAAAGASAPEPITLYATPLIAKALAADLAVPGALPAAGGATDVVAISALLMIENAIDPAASTPEETRVVAQSGAQSDFNRLLQRVLRWTIETFGPGYPSVTASELAAIATTLGEDATFDTGFSTQSLDEFLNANVAVTLQPRLTSGLTSVAFFPMIAALSLTTNDYSFDFGTTRTITAAQEALIAEYFSKLAADYANMVEKNPSGTVPAPRAFAALADESVAQFLFRRWFLLLAQGAVQAASDLLERYTYTVADPAHESLASIAAQFSSIAFSHVTQPGDTLARLAQEYDALPSAIEAANPTVDFQHLPIGISIVIPVQVFVAYLTRKGDTPQSIADEFGTTVAALESANPQVPFGAPDAQLAPGTALRVPVEVTPHTIVAANAATLDLLRPWAAPNGLVQPAGGPQRPVFSTIAYQIVDGDTMDSVAKRFGIDATVLMTANPQTPGLLRLGGVAALGNLTTAARAGDTLQTIATFYGFAERIADMLAANTPGIPLVAQQMIVPGVATTVPLTEGQTLEAFALLNATTPAELLSVNHAILVVPNTIVKLPAVTYTASGVTIPVAYLGTAGETLDAIAERFLGAGTPENRNLIAHANPTVAFPLAAPTPLTFAAPETPANLLGTFAIPPQTLYSAANTSNATLLAPRGVFTIPPIEPAITAGDTFSSLAQRFNLTLDEVAGALANTAGLFRDPDPAPVKLAIPYVPALPLDRLVAEIGASGQANETSAMASRFLLAGLRLPNPSDPAFVADPHDPNLPTYPLFSLSGQQFQAPSSDPTAYTLAFEKTGTAPWLTVPGGTLTFPLSPEEAAQVTEYASITLEPNVLRSERLALSSSVRVQRTLQTSYHWQAGEKPALPPSGAAAGEPMLWLLPDALRASIAPVSPSGVPYELETTTPTPAGPPVDRAVTSARWATTVALQIARVPSQTSDGPNLPGTFLMRGADQLGTETLLGLMRQLAHDGATLSLLYASDPSDPNGGGMVSDALDRTQVVLVKTNLSTLSNGTPALHATERAQRVDALASASAFTATLTAADSLEFIELLWECSVVRSGGFYLTYRAAGGNSFPDAIFDVSGLATITLVALLDSQPSIGTSLLLPLNDSVVIGENVDSAASTLFARAAAHPVVPNDTLTTIAAAFGDVVPPPTPASLAQANATVHHLLDPQKTIVVNGAEQPIGPLDTFDSIAAAAHTTPAALGTANATRAMFQPGALVQPLDGMLTVAPTLRPGNTGFHVTRVDPQQLPDQGRALGTADAQSEVDTLFNLLGFSITPNASFAASGEGLPAQPTHVDGDPNWNYSQALAAYAYAHREPLKQIVPASPALPPPEMNPYAGIAAGAQLDVELTFHDVNGNRPGIAPLRPPIVVGYTDDLIPVSGWPSTSTAYEFSAAGGGAHLAVDVRFSATAYMPAPGADYPVSHDKARVDRQQLVAAYFQTRMPDLRFSLDTSIATVDGDPAAVASALRLALQDYLAQAYVFTTAAAALPPVSATSGTTTGTLASMATAYETVPGTLAQANASADAAALFAAHAQLNIPRYYRVATGDTLRAIAVAILPDGTQAERLALVRAIGTANQKLALSAGTALIAKARSVTIDERNGDLASCAAIAASQHVAISGDPVSGLTGLGTANTGAALGAGITLAYQDAPSIVVAPNQTLADAVAIFAKTVPSASADGVAQTNRVAQRFFAGAGVVSLPNYVAQPDDTLASVAANVGPVNPVSGDSPAAQLLIDNLDVRDVFPPGTSLFYGLVTYAVREGDTLQSIADSFAITVEDLGSRNAVIPLQPNQTLRIPFLVDASGVASSTYRADGTESLAAIVGRYAAWQNDPNAIAAFVELNRYVAAQFDPAKPITIGNQTRTPTLASTIDTLATAFGLDPLAFATQIAHTAGYVRAGAIFYAVAMTSASQEKLSAVAARFHAGVAELADANASVYGLVAPGQTVTVAGYALPTGSAETFTTLAARVNAARAANDQPPWIAPGDVAIANPDMLMQAATLAPPVRTAEVEVTVTARYDAAIAPVTVTLTTTREETLVDPEFKTARSVFASSVAVAPRPSAGGQDQDGAPLFSLREFAAQFEAAFPGFKLATGADAGYGLDAQRAACGTVVPTNRGLFARSAAAGAPDPLANRRLWTVNLGAGGGRNVRFNYQVDRAGLRFFAYPPLTTSLWDSGDLAVQTYVSGVGLTGSQTQRFQAVEPDQWARSFLETLDGLLAPASAANLYGIPAPVSGGTKPIDAILTVKNGLASAIRDELIPIFGGAGGGETEARERFYQELLIQIGSAYSNDVLVQYPITVESGCTNPETAARLSGKPLANVYRTPKTGAVGVADVAKALGVSVAYLEDTIATTHFLVGAQLETKLGVKSYRTGNDDTLASLAAIYGVTVAVLVSQIEVVTPNAGLLRNDAVVNVTQIVRPIAAGDTLVTLATAMGGTVIGLAQANADRPGVFVPGSPIALQGYPATQVPPAGSFESVATKLGITLDALGGALWNADVTGATGAYTLTAHGAALALVAVPPPYSFTTAKVPLANGTSYMTSVFDVKDAALQRSIFLDLEYAITEMEYDIVQDENALGAYQASSWLTFILPITANSTAFPNDNDLGFAEIPMPLRAYPQPFVLDGATAEYPDGTNTGGDTIFEWSYAFRAQRTMAPQDTGGLTAGFNVPETPGTTSLAAAPDGKRDPLFRQLAQFAFVFPALSNDLALLGLATRDASQTQRVTAAVNTFVALAQQIESAWTSTAHVRAAFASGGDIYTYRLQTLVDESAPSTYGYLLLDEPTGPPDFSFTLALSYQANLVAGPVDAALHAAFAKQGYVLSANAVVAVVTPNAVWTIVDAPNDLTFILTLRSTSITVARRYLWPALASFAGKPYHAQQIGAGSLYTFGGNVEDPMRLQLTFDRLQVIGKQNAIAGMSVTRNANLVPGRTTDSSFVYQTPTVALPGITTPSSVIVQPIDLRSYPGATDLASALGGFFGVVFAAQIAASPGTTRRVAIDATYSYAISPDNPVPVCFPLALVPQFDYAVSTDGDPTKPTSFVSRFASFVESQATQAGIAAATGSFAFRFTVFSTVEGGSGARPILQFEDLEFPRKPSPVAARAPLTRTRPPAPKRNRAL